MRVDIMQIVAAQTQPLRQSVLRAGLGLETCIFPGDEAAQTIHLGALDVSGAIVGVASVYREALPRDGLADEAAHRSLLAGPDVWRLRGMAVDESHQGRGIGSQLLRATLDRVRASGGQWCWCNARTPAQAFYERHGLRVVSGRFDIPTAGPHVRMAIELAAFHT